MIILALSMSAYGVLPTTINTKPKRLKVVEFSIEYKFGKRVEQVVKTSLNNSYKYSPNGLVSEMNDEKQNLQTRYQYNNEKLCTNIAVFQGETCIKVTSVSYLVGGRIQEIATIKDGSIFQKTVYEYTNGHPMMISEYNADGVLSEYQRYQYTEEGKLSSIEIGSGTQYDQATKKYQLFNRSVKEIDSNGRVSALRYSLGGGKQYQYDSAGRLEYVQQGLYWYLPRFHYYYDKNNNVERVDCETSSQETGESKWVATKVFRYFYEY